MKTLHANLDIVLPIKEKSSIYKKILKRCKELRHKISSKNKNFDSVKAIRELRSEE